MSFLSTAPVDAEGWDVAAAPPVEAGAVAPGVPPAAAPTGLGVK